MKRVTFVAEGELTITLEADFSATAAGEQGAVRIQAEGVDIEGTQARGAHIYGWFSPLEAREIARYLKEMADTAEGGRQ